MHEPEAIAASLARSLRASIKPRLCNGRPVGFIVAFEGVDGAGVTSNSRIFALLLERLYRGPGVVYAKQPSGTPIGSVIREALGGGLRLAPEALTHLFIADRLQQLYGEGLLEKLLEGYVLVFDRYKYSNAVYQSMLVEPESVYTLEDILEANSAAPPAHVIVYLDVDPATAYSRIVARRGRIEVYEQPRILERVRDGYKSLMRLLAERPEWRGSGVHPWTRRVERLGVDPRCLYPCKAPILVEVDATKPLPLVARNVAQRLLELLGQSGLATVGQ